MSLIASTCAWMARVLHQTARTPIPLQHLIGHAEQSRVLGHGVPQPTDRSSSYPVQCGGWHPSQDPALRDDEVSALEKLLVLLRSPSHVDVVHSGRGGCLCQAEV